VKSTRVLLVAVLAATAFSPAARSAMVGVSYSWQFDGAAQFHLSGKAPDVFTHSISEGDSRTYTVEHSQGSAFLTLPGDGSVNANLGSGAPGTGVSIPFASFGATGVLGGSGEELSYFVAQVPVMLTITDTASGESAVLSGIAGFQGSIGDNLSSYAALVTFSTASATLDGRLYTVRPISSDWIAFPESNGAPLTLPLEVIASGNDVSLPETAPEPSTLLLSLGAASLCGLAASRRRRK
jgi:hypothetical protein